MKDDRRQLVFVYGTLRRNASNAFRMKGGTWEGMRTVRGSLYQISWYPGLILDRGDGKVIGEIWSVDPEKLRQLDEFEGLPPGALEGDEYRRRRVMVEPLPGPEDGSEWDSASTSIQPEEAWVWEWTGQTEAASLIPTGDWLDVDSPRQKPLFTSIGCLAILSFTVGTKALLAGLVFLFPRFAIPEGVHFWAWVAGLILAAGVGGYSLHMATKRREPGHPFQIMTGMAVLLLGMYGLVALLITLFALLSG